MAFLKSNEVFSNVTTRRRRDQQRNNASEDQPEYCPIYCRLRRINECRSVVISKQSDCEVNYDPAKYQRGAAKHGKRETHRYAKVFDKTTSQWDVHEGLTQRMAEKFREGRNQLLLLEGVSGGGKTYTLFGEKKKGNGLLHLLVEDLLPKPSNNENYALKGAYYFIYKNKYIIYDARGSEVQMPEKHNNHGHSDYVEEVRKHLTWYPLGAHSEVARLAHKINIQRITKATNVNKTSSRGQAVIILRLEPKQMPDRTPLPTKESRYFYIVDMAGQEAVGSGVDAAETRSINTANRHLVDVARALQDPAAGKPSDATVNQTIIGSTLCLLLSRSFNVEVLLCMPMDPTEDERHQVTMMFELGNILQGIRINNPPGRNDEVYTAQIHRYVSTRSAHRRRPNIFEGSTPEESEADSDLHSPENQQWDRNISEESAPEGLGANSDLHNPENQQSVGNIFEGSTLEESEADSDSDLHNPENQQSVGNIFEGSTLEESEADSDSDLHNPENQQSVGNIFEGSTLEESEADSDSDLHNPENQQSVGNIFEGSTLEESEADSDSDLHNPENQQSVGNIFEGSTLEESEADSDSDLHNPENQQRYERGQSSYLELFTHGAGDKTSQQVSTAVVPHGAGSGIGSHASRSKSRSHRDESSRCGGKTSQQVSTAVVPHGAGSGIGSHASRSKSRSHRDESSRCGGKTSQQVSTAVVPHGAGSGIGSHASRSKSRSHRDESSRCGGKIPVTLDGSPQHRESTNASTSQGSAANEWRPLPKEDRESLEPGKYITDECVKRYVTYLQTHQWLDHRFRPDDYDVILPSVCTDLKTHAPHLEYKKKWTFFLYNDKEANHWMLCFFYRDDKNRSRNTLFCYDSLGGLEEGNSRINRVMNEVHSAIGSVLPDDAPTQRRVFRLPAQTNSYDCGVFMLIFLLHFPKTSDRNYRASAVECPSTTKEIEEHGRDWIIAAIDRSSPNDTEPTHFEISDTLPDQPRHGLHNRTARCDHAEIGELPGRHRGPTTRQEEIVRISSDHTGRKAVPAEEYTVTANAQRRAPAISKKCQICMDKSYSTATRLVDHSLSKHAELRYACRRCDGTGKNQGPFSWFEDLKRHFKNVHKLSRTEVKAESRHYQGIRDTVYERLQALADANPGQRYYHVSIRGYLLVRASNSHATSTEESE